MKLLQPILFLLLTAASAEAQTITLGPITKYAYCVGDTLIIAYQSGGSFAGDNHFTLQVSGPKGSFANFTNFGHDSTAAGEFRFPLIYEGNYYRFRVASSDPYLFSAPCDSDVISSAYPTPEPVEVETMKHAPVEPAGLINSTINLQDWKVESAGSTYQWTCAQDATPSLSTLAAPTVTYPTAGAKPASLTVTNVGGCSSTVNFHIHVFNCNPTIPHGAHVVTGTETGGDLFVWVQAGGAYTTTGRDQTVFVEPGGYVDAASNWVGTFYLRNGSSFASQSGYSILIIDSGMKIDGNSARSFKETFQCDGLTFDYSLVSPSGCRPVLPLAIRRVTGTAQGNDGAVWVKSGGNYTATGGVGNPQTIFVEDGGTVTATSAPEGIYYLKRGANFSNQGKNGDLKVIMAAGRKIAFSPGVQQMDTMTCGDLSFDYSQVNASIEATQAPAITISQNSDHLRITGDQPTTTCRIFSLLGTELLSQRGEGKLDVDLTLLPAGMYFALVQAGDERVVRKVLVTH